VRNLYEAMFVVDSAKAKENYAKIEEECRACITRHGGEVVKAVKWDDRRLCYEIRKVKRGTFILVHFEAEGPAIAKIERQCKITEAILRVLILRDIDGVETNTGGGKGEGEEAAAAASARSAE